MYASQLKNPPQTSGRRLMEELQEFNEAVLASAGSGAALAGGRHLQRLAKKKKTKCSFPDLMGIFTDRWVLAAVPAVHVLCCWQPSRQLWPSIPTQPAPHAGAGAAGSIASSPSPPPSALSWTSAWGWMSACQPSDL